MDIDMDIKELEAFVYVVENCSFSRAAELLHLTQPTISSHVSALERKLNIKLIVRTTKETYPSDAGKLLYKYAKEILQVRENAAIALRNFSQEMKGTISIAASTVPSQYYLPHLLQDFRARYPDITFNIQMEDSPKVVELVATRSVEIGFCGTMVASHKCVYQDFASDPMVLITPNTEKYQAFAGKPFPIEQLKEETFISREKGSGTYQAGKELLNELGIDIAQLRTAVEIRSTESVKQMVSEGLGVGLIAQSAAQDYVQFGKLLAFPFPDSRFRRQLYRPLRRCFTTMRARQRTSPPQSKKEKHPLIKRMLFYRESAFFIRFFHEIVIYIFSALVYDIAIGQRLRCTGKAAGLTGGKAMDCRDSALFTGVDEASCENMLRCFSAYEQRFSAGQTILTCGQQQDMIGVLLSGSAALLRLHADGNRTVLESMDEGSVFGEELAFTGFRDGSALIECREDCRVIFMRYDQITKRCENACACHSQVVTNLFQLLSKKSLHLSRRIEVLACRSIREKLLCFFEQLADEHGSRTFPLPFSLSMLADYISADRSAMMREMRKMREEDLISTEGRSVTLL